MQSIRELDIKTNMCFLDSISDGDLPIISFSEPGFYQIDDFLTSRECEEIVNKCKLRGFSTLPFRESKRIISKDSNYNLLNTISFRLSESNILNSINGSSKKVYPYGFNSNLVHWNQNEAGNINEFFRVNEYTDGCGFPEHRDAQLTLSPLVKSNFSVIVYLNDDFEGGQTIFIENNESLFHNGVTVEKEIRLSLNCKRRMVTPKRGRCIIFDQRLLHKAEKVRGNSKYILRTDLFVVGEWRENLNKTSLLLKIEDLTKSLFRQAQYNELLNLPSNEIYERCLSLRQYPHLLTVYPEHLEKLLTHNVNKLDVLENLKFLSRNGCSYIFQLDTNNFLKALKVASIFTILSLTNQIDIHFVKQFKKILYALDLNFDFVIYKPEEECRIHEYHRQNFELVEYEYIKTLVSRFSKEGEYSGDVYDLTCSVINKDLRDGKMNKSYIDSEYRKLIELRYQNMAKSFDILKERHRLISKFDNIKKRIIKASQTFKSPVFPSTSKISEIGGLDSQRSIDTIKCEIENMKVKFKQMTSNFDDVIEEYESKLSDYEVDISKLDLYDSKIKDNCPNISVKELLETTLNLKLNSLNELNGETTEKKPASTLVTLCGSEFKNKCFCSKVVKTNCGYGIYGVKMEYHIGNFIIKIKPESDTTGKVNFLTPVEYFNHAGCNCASYININKKNINVEHELSYEIIDNRLTINVVSNIVV